MMMKSKTSRIVLFLGAVIFLFAFSAGVFAQEAERSGETSSQDAAEALLDPELYVGLEESYQKNMALRNPRVKSSQLQTLFFTMWQHRLLQEAKRQAWNNPGASQSEMEQDPTPAQRHRGIRELSLGGILRTSSDEWTVWLNGSRVTPTAIPKQVLDIQVRQDFVELKWYDSYTNLIFPVRLQAHQRFNLDTRMFLPGASTL